MREILFRGKRVDNGEWVEGNFVKDAMEQIQGINCGLDGYIRNYNVEKRKVEMHEVERKTVGQYTGLTDKNGVKIFEGDIVQTPKYGVQKEVGAVFPGKDRYSVAYNDGTYILGNRLRKFNLRADVTAEVIGNIYDNPELLESEYC